MAARLVEADLSARELVERAGEEGGFDAITMLGRGGPRFHETRVVQPLLTAVSLACWRRLVELGVTFDVCLGHSLGELAAWCCSGGPDAEATVTLAARRGAIAGPITDRALANGAGLITIESAEWRTHSVLQPLMEAGHAGLAVENSRCEVVLWADAVAMAPLRRAFAAAPLPAMGPWHGHRMMEGLPAYRQEVEAVERRFGLPRLGPALVLNQDGRPRAGDEPVAAAIAEQFVAPVAFASCVAALVQRGVTDVVGLGPAAGLRRTLVSNGLQARYWVADDVDGIAAAARALA
jgi:[acyl-carrier-protein] S-malonyltransferase